MTATIARPAPDLYRAHMVAALENPVVRRQVHAISIPTYHLMIDAGFDERVELIRGVLVEKMPKSPLHETLVDNIHELVKHALPGFWVRKEAPLTLRDSEPEPDVSVVTGRRSEFQDKHPSTAKLAIEVALSSEAIDREKGLIYAEAGIEEYWLVLADEHIVEVYSEPLTGNWSTMRRHLAGDTIKCSSLPPLSITVAELFAV